MKLNEAERILVRMVICEARERDDNGKVQKNVDEICSENPLCQTCPYYVKQEDVTEALGVVFRYYTPEQLQKEVQP